MKFHCASNPAALFAAIGHSTSLYCCWPMPTSATPITKHTMTANKTRADRIAASLLASTAGCVHMGVRVSHNREPRRHSVTDMARAMPHLRRCIDDVSLTRHKDGHVTDLEFVLSLEHEPELRS